MDPWGSLASQVILSVFSRPIREPVPKNKVRGTLRNDTKVDVLMHARVRVCVGTHTHCCVTDFLERRGQVSVHPERKQVVPIWY